jgi:predicted metal-dependent hydrolase
MKAQMAKASRDKWKDAEALRASAQEWSVKIRVSLRQVSLRQMKRKWASISTAGRLTLNTDLLNVPKSLGEYVIVHELVHLLAPNHGKVFKSFLYAYLPDWEDRANRLRQYSRDDTLHN